jgi:membrane protease YdiL (CAAX protease family)
MKKRSTEILGIAITFPLATFLWYVIFALKAGNFWLKISFSAALLAGISLIVAPDLKKQFTFLKRHIFIGILSAIVLYGIFWVGNGVLTSLFQSAKASISAVYAPKKGVPLWGITLLLLCVTSPAEEIFWRGFIQRLFMQKINPPVGFLLSVFCYAGVHVWSLNIPLILAAFIAGLFWGLLYISQKSLIPVIISHALWSVIIFIVFPFG